MCCAVCVCVCVRGGQVSFSLVLEQLSVDQASEELKQGLREAIAQALEVVKASVQLLGLEAGSVVALCRVIGVEHAEWAHEVRGDARHSSAQQRTWRRRGGVGEGQNPGWFDHSVFFFPCARARL